MAMAVLPRTTTAQPPPHVFLYALPLPYSEADRMCLAEEDDEHDIFDSDGTGLDEATAQQVRGCMEDQSRGAVIVNSYGMMSMVNKATCSMFG